MPWIYLQGRYHELQRHSPAPSTPFYGLEIYNLWSTDGYDDRRRPNILVAVYFFSYLRRKDCWWTSIDDKLRTESRQRVRRWNRWMLFCSQNAAAIGKYARKSCRKEVRRSGYKSVRSQSTQHSTAILFKYQQQLASHPLRPPYTITLSNVWSSLLESHLDR